MATRTIETTITFRRPFALTSVDSQQPAGTYRLVIDEEEIVGLTRLAFQRVGTQLHTPALSAFGGPTQIFFVNAGELAAALRADGRGTRSCAFPVEAMGTPAEDLRLEQKAFRPLGLRSRRLRSV